MQYVTGTCQDYLYLNVWSSWDDTENRWLVFSLLRRRYSKHWAAINNKIEYKIVKESSSLMAGGTSVMKGFYTAYLRTGHYIKVDQCLGQSIYHSNSRRPGHREWPLCKYSDVFCRGRCLNVTNRRLQEVLSMDNLNTDQYWPLAIFTDDHRAARTINWHHGS